MPDSTLVTPGFRIPDFLVVKAPAGVLTVGSRLAIGEFPFTIGRADAKLTIDDASVSRMHAQVTIDAKSRRYVITDMGSSNGTRVNGAPLTPGQPMFIDNGTHVQIGPNVELVFEKS